jgi:hypothetical protein
MGGLREGSPPKYGSLDGTVVETLTREEVVLLHKQ